VLTAPTSALCALIIVPQPSKFGRHEVELAPAVDEEIRAGYVGASGRRQVDDRLGDVGDLTEASKRDMLKFKRRALGSSCIRFTSTRR